MFASKRKKCVAMQNRCMSCKKYFQTEFTGDTCAQCEGKEKRWTSDVVLPWGTEICLPCHVDVAPSKRLKIAGKTSDIQICRPIVETVNSYDEDEEDEHGDALAHLIQDVDIIEMFPNLDRHHLSSATNPPAREHVGSGRRHGGGRPSTRSSPSRDNPAEMSAVINAVTVNNPSTLAGGAEVGESTTTTQSDGDGSGAEAYRYCCNCHRKSRPVYNNMNAEGLTGETVIEALYLVDIESYAISDNSFRRKFCTLRLNDFERVSRKQRKVNLCSICAQYLLHEKSKNTMDLVWCAMIWMYLSSTASLSQHGYNVWSVVPDKWRLWWIDEARKINPVLGNITLFEPPSSVLDVTFQKKELEESIENCRLADLKQKVDEHLLPLVKCPWGCTEFYHKTGSIPFDVTIARCLGSEGVMLATNNAKKMIQGNALGMREDFLLRAKDDDYYLWNPQWVVKPSICFLNGAPMFLTCRDHIDGGKGRYLHPPMNPFGNVPSRLGDQLTPAVVRPRTIKPIRPHAYSHTYQMHEMRGQFNGVDTIRITKQGNFGAKSHLLRKNESLSIQGRCDIKGMLSRWKEEERVIPKWLGEQMLLTAKKDVPNITSFDRFVYGATYVTLDDAVKLQVMAKSNAGATVSIPKVSNDGTVNRQQVHFSPIWPRFVTHVHAYNEHGAAFPVIPCPLDKERDCRLLWFFVGMHACIPAIWESTVRDLKHQEQWNGWLLSLVTELCFPYLSRRGSPRSTNPFAFPARGGRLRKETKLMELLGMVNSSPSESGNGSSQPVAIGADGASIGISILGSNDSSNDESVGSNLHTEFDSVDSDSEDVSQSNTGDSYGSHPDTNANADIDTIASDDSAEPEFSDGYFYPEHLKKIFYLRSDVLVTPYDQDDVSVERSHRVHVVFRNSNSIAIAESQNSDNHLAFETEDSFGRKWELRYLGISQPDVSTYTFHKWKGRIYCRHGGTAFPAWWYQDNKDNLPQRHTEESIAADEVSNWNIAVYVPSTLEDLETVRDNFLSSLGGQTKVYCEQHSFPLIIAPHKSGGLCCMTVEGRSSSDHSGGCCCKKEAAFICPVDDCPSKICIRHHKNIPLSTGMNGEKFRLAPPTPQQQQQHGETVDENNGLPGEVVQREHEAEDSDGDGSDEDSSYKSDVDEQMHDEITEDNYLPNLLTEFHRQLQRDGRKAEDSDEDESDDEQQHETTTENDDLPPLVRRRIDFNDSDEHQIDDDSYYGSALDASVSSTSSGDSDNLEHLEDADSIVEEEDMTSSQHSGSDNSSEMESYFYEQSFQQDVPNDFGFVIEAATDYALPEEQDEDSDSENDNLDGQDMNDRLFRNQIDIPTTSSGAPPPLETETDQFESIAGHVILNNCGTLLARKKHKLSGTKRQQSFLQRIVSTSAGRCVPLVYPEAMLFPSIFWKDDGVSGSILGAIPSALMAQDSTLAKHGFASIQSHLRSRVTNSSLLTSTDDKYLCYAFDCLVNLGCRGQDTRVILHRGLSSSKEGVKIVGANEPLFDTDSVDSRPVVNKLAAAFADKEGHYFYTQTVNQQEFFGVRRIKRWIDSDELAQELKQTNGNSSWEVELELREASRRAAAVALLRNWMETAEIWMGYILRSPEKPLGKVFRLWWRHEYQDTQGNLSHIHALLWIDTDSGRENDRTIQDRIRGSTLELIRPDEIDRLVDEGILNNFTDVVQVQAMAMRVLNHVCSYRCKKRVGIEDGQLKCRVPNNGVENPNPLEHTVKEFFVNHSKACCEIMELLGLFTTDPLTGQSVPANDVLKATKHYPPACAGEGIISPCCGRLFAATFSSQNLKFVTGYLASRYLAKYVALVDEHNKVYVGAMANNPDGVKLDYEQLCNTKVTGSAIQERMRLAKRRDKNHPTGRAISMMEVISVLLGYEQVYTNMQFVHIPTVPLVERPALDRRKPLWKLQKEGVIPANVNVTSPEDLDCSRVIPAFKVRNEEMRDMLPVWRKLSTSDTLVLRDQIFSPFSIDATTIFSIRPPELRFVRNQGKYFRWFYRDTSSGRKAKKMQAWIQHYREQVGHSLGKTAWIDGTSCFIYLRPKAISEILQYLELRRDDDFYGYDQIDPLDTEIVEEENAKYLSLRLFEKLSRNNANPPHSRSTQRLSEWIEMRERFIGPAARDKFCELPIVWYNSISPTQPHRWIPHILWSMGEFDNEMNLLGYGNMRECFVRAKLLHPDPARTEEGVRAITKRYILEQLAFLPGGSKQFDKFVVAAYQALYQYLVHDTLASNELPAALYTKLHADTKQESIDHINNTKQMLVTRTLVDLSKKGLGQLPTAAEFMNATTDSPLDWNLEPMRGPHQSEESFEEQRLILVEGQNRFLSYQQAEMSTSKGLIVVGGPGVGKTTLLQMFALLGLTRGLLVCLTAIMSERAKQLGGSHIAQLFCIPVNNHATPTRLTELAVINLCRYPKRYSMLQQVDIILIDELGQVSAEMISVLDMILRRVRSSSQFMGGILVMSTMDVLQLHPVKGHPPLLSPHMITCFTFHQLVHSVRASQDALLQEIQQITRLLPGKLTPALKRRFRYLIETCCTFVASWDDPRLTPNKLRMFGKKAATARAESRLLRAMKNKYGSEMLKRTSVDFESTLEGNWVDASAVTSKALSKSVKEPRQVCFYPGAHYEITFNKEGSFSHGQVAVLAKLPTSDELDSFTPVSVYVAPEGCKTVPENAQSREDFIALGWSLQTIGSAPERPESLRFGIQAKRRQYGICHRIAATVHAGMGQDLPSVVTRVSEVDTVYALWEREQEVVLLSRTSFAKDIYFVGDPKKTSAALLKLLSKESQYAAYISYLLERLCGNQNAELVVVDQARQPFRPIDIELPQDSSGYVYILLSLRDRKTTYIGQTTNLVKRLRQHNSGYGASSTSDPTLRPWALLGFVAGFKGMERRHRLTFEGTWQAMRDRRQSAFGPMSPDDIAALSHELITQQPALGLRYVKCGTMMDAASD